MEIPILRNKQDLLESGSYRVRVGEWYRTESALGSHVFVRFDVLEKGLAHHCIKAWVDAELTGGERPSQLYSWISALEFDGEALPDGYSLETATLLLREALAEVEFVDEHPLFYNQITRLCPLNGTAGRHAEAP